tara:strand:- start:60 stop:923 length:864 start_codon:yes stop_codon:yes gene_type:complete
MLKSKIAIGSAQFGMKYGIANKNGLLKNKEILSIINLCSNHGIMTIDTARSYGSAEKKLGTCLKIHLDKKWDIITKINNLDNNLVEGFEKSAKNLNVSPSTILAHSSKIYLNKNFQNQAQQMKSEKQINNFGVSLYDHDEVMKVLDCKIKPDIIQLPLNILDTRLYRSGLLNQIAKNGVKIHIRSVFLQGMFYLSKEELFEKFPDAVSSIGELKIIAEEENISLAELSLLWVTSLNIVNKIIIGIDSKIQLIKHLNTLDKKVNRKAFEKALSVRYENKNILNPSLWN